MVRVEVSELGEKHLIVSAWEAIILAKNGELKAGTTWRLSARAWIEGTPVRERRCDPCVFDSQLLRK